MVLKSMLLGASTKIIKKATAINGYTSMLIGCGLTMAVQSSSVTTSVLTPLVGLDIVSLQQMYPLTLGANIGTCITSIMAALVSSTSTAMQVGLAHLFFNLFGIVIWYPVPFMRRIPIAMARALGKATRWWRGFPFLYIGTMFVIVPLILLGLSSLFVSKSKALVTLGTLLLIFLILGAAKFAYWWTKKDGRAKTEANFKRRQFKKDVMTAIIDEWNPLVEDVKNLKNHTGYEQGDYDADDDVVKDAGKPLDDDKTGHTTVHDSTREFEEFEKKYINN